MKAEEEFIFCSLLSQHKAGKSTWRLYKIKEGRRVQKENKLSLGTLSLMNSET